MKALLFAMLVSSSVIASASASAPVLSQTQVVSAAQTLSVFDRSFTTLDQITTAVSADGFDYRPEFTQADQALLALGFEIAPDQSWMKSRGQALLNDPSLIQSASMLEIRSLLGGISRLERFVPGLMGKAILNGVYAASHARVIELLNARN